MGTLFGSCGMSSALLPKLHGETHVNTGPEVRALRKKTQLEPREGCHSIVSADGVGHACQRFSFALAYILWFITLRMERGNNDVQAQVFIVNSISFLLLATYPRCVTLCIVEFPLLDTSIIHSQHAPFLSNVSPVPLYPLPQTLYTFTPTPLAIPPSCRLKIHIKTNCTT